MPRFEEPHSRWTKGCREGSRIVLNARSQSTPRPRRVQHLRARGRADEKDTVLLTPCECKLALTVWFQAIYLMTQDKKGVSAMKLHRHLGISYNAAWRMRHKLVQVMMEQDCEHPTVGRVELDDAYLGHSATGHSTLLACVDAETRNPTAKRWGWAGRGRRAVPTGARATADSTIGPFTKSRCAPSRYRWVVGTSDRRVPAVRAVSR